MATHSVKVYALSTCIHCKHTKEFLNTHNIPYDCINVDQLSGDEKRAVIAEMKHYNPKASFPTVVIDEDCVVVGFKEKELEEKLS